MPEEWKLDLISVCSEWSLTTEWQLLHAGWGFLISSLQF